MEVGRAVRRLKAGDKVMLSAAVGCGSCASCLAGEINQCANGMAQCYGLSHRLEGCQAEAIRAPFADFNVARIPDGLTADQALMLTDNLPTAWFGLRNAGVGPGRRAIAESLGAIAFGEDAVVQIAELTSGRMADCAVEAVGADATIRLAMNCVGRMGTVSVIGVNMSPGFDFPMGVAFMKNLTFRIGTCSVPKWWAELAPLIQGGRLRPERYITHHMPLSEGAEAYRLFDARQAGALKMVLTG